jgi:hypothetical protein
MLASGLRWGLYRDETEASKGACIAVQRMSLGFTGERGGLFAR